MSDDPAAFVVPRSRKQMLLCILISVPVVALGIYASFHEVGLPLNGPKIIILRGLFFLIVGIPLLLLGLWGLLIPATYLIVDERGIVAPRERLMIGWDQVLGVNVARVVTAHFLLVQVRWPEERFDNVRRKYKRLFDLNKMSGDLVPISLTGARFSSEELLAVVNKFSKKGRP